jgi:hypothetical protein
LPLVWLSPLALHPPNLMGKLRAIFSTNTVPFDQPGSPQ